METMGAFFDEEWDSLSKMFFCEDADSFMLGRLQGGDGDDLFSNDSETASMFPTPSIFWPPGNNGGNENVVGVDGSFICSDNFDYITNFHNMISQESSQSSANDINLVHQVTNDVITNVAMDFYLMDHQNSNINIPESHQQPPPVKVAEFGNEEMMMKRKFPEQDRTNNDDSSENPKKKPRLARNANKAKKNVQPKSKKNNQKAKEVISNNEEDEAQINVQNGQSSSCYSSEDDSNASQESNGDNKAPAALNLNGKARATRGAATDPQSLYARKRRERINERLRILQNLIPNGTKVDISTMLEEAVHYVKFLQLQIKLLSSDDMWMYAPIVYNGLDIGLYGKIFPTQ